MNKRERLIFKILDKYLEEENVNYHLWNKGEYELISIYEKDYKKTYLLDVSKTSLKLIKEEILKLKLSFNLINKKDVIVSSLLKAYDIYV